jgi:hypothetical protein
MTRRASLPGADELFRSTSPALTSVKQADVEPAKPLVAPAIAASPALINLRLVVKSMTKR